MRLFKAYEKQEATARDASRRLAASVESLAGVGTAQQASAHGESSGAGGEPAHCTLCFPAANLARVRNLEVGMGSLTHIAAHVISQPQQAGGVSRRSSPHSSRRSSRRGRRRQLPAVRAAPPHGPVPAA